MGPQSFSPPHIDPGNSIDGWCTSTALGSFNADKGGQMVFWNKGIRLVIRFPSGSSMLFPSGQIVHSNVPIQPHEFRYSLIQYTAGALFRWRYNRYQSDKLWLSKATAKEKAAREEERKVRWIKALDSFTRWKDLLAGSWRGSTDVKLGSEVDLTELEEGSERPTKRTRF